MFYSVTLQPTSHIWSWKRRRSFSISSAISAPVISVRIIPCCLACSRFSFSIFVLTQRRGRLLNRCTSHPDHASSFVFCNMCNVFYNNPGGSRQYCCTLLTVFDSLNSTLMSYMVQITANFNYPLTTWPRSLSMLCQRASLCPAETQEDKHQQTTKRSPGGWSYLQSWIAPRVPANASLRSQFMLRSTSKWPRPSSYPQHQGFVTQILATRLKHNTKAVFTSARFTVRSFELRTLPRPSSLLSYTRAEV